MPIVIAALVFVGGLCLLNLLLTFGVIRRLREQTEMLTTRMSAVRVGGLSAGKTPGPFSAVTSTGEPVHGATGLRLLAFFSTCPACPERMAPFADYLRTHHVGREAVLAVSVGSGSDPHPYLADLAPLAQICVEPEDGPVARAFEVTAFPSFFLLDADGVVIASGYDPVKLLEPAAA